ncbi:MAG: SAM-dependent methyltransferase [Caldanaerobacter subterraneus]|nr:MAG: SAM-dependent methyltransferase [Caldanaerobacter subterraneus]
MRDGEFNLWAKDYDMDVKKSERENRYLFAAYKEVLNTVYSKVSGYEKKIILDLGFGTGVLTKRLFENTEEMLKAKEKDKDIWDDEEHYIIADKIAKLLPYLKVNFEKLSYCSGVLTIRKSD